MWDVILFVSFVLAVGAFVAAYLFLTAPPVPDDEDGGDWFDPDADARGCGPPARAGCRCRCRRSGLDLSNLSVDWEPAHDDD